MQTTTNGQANNAYVALFRSPPKARFWTGFMLSALGDAMTRVALIWFVYQKTHSPAAVGLLLLCYTGPVLVGGPLAGLLLDRFDRGRVMLVDNAIRGLAIGLAPVLYALGLLSMWHLYLVAGIYGFLYMMSLAGTPALIPSLVTEQEQLPAANALETLTYTLTGVLGPPIAGVLITTITAPNVLILDAVSYALFVLALAGLPLQRASGVGSDDAQSHTAQNLAVVASHSRMPDAVRLLLFNQVLLATTLMFILFNVGAGFLAVWLPVLADHLPTGGSVLYGVLLGVMALGEVVGAALSGILTRSSVLGSLICLAQLLSGLSLALVVFGQIVGQPLWGAGVGLVLFGFFSAPLTVWAQTLRMQIIPAPLRGRTFALLRTLMQGAGPLASAAAGVLLPLLGMIALMAASSLLIGAPGALGMRVAALRRAAAISVTVTNSPS